MSAEKAAAYATAATAETAHAGKPAAGEGIRIAREAQGTEAIARIRDVLDDHEAAISTLLKSRTDSVMTDVSAQTETSTP